MVVASFGMMFLVFLGMIAFFGGLAFAAFRWNSQSAGDDPSSNEESAMIRCPACQQETSASGRFCVHCGAEL